MRKMIWIAMMSATLFAGACKKKDDSAKEMDRAATTASKAQENVNDQSKDVRDQQKDVNKDQKEMAKDQNDVAKEQGDLYGHVDSESLEASVAAVARCRPVRREAAAAASSCKGL